MQHYIKLTYILISLLLPTSCYKDHVCPQQDQLLNGICFLNNDINPNTILAISYYTDYYIGQSISHLLTKKLRDYLNAYYISLYFEPDTTNIDDSSTTFFYDNNETYSVQINITYKNNCLALTNYMHEYLHLADASRLTASQQQDNNVDIHPDDLFSYQGMMGYKQYMVYLLCDPAESPYNNKPNKPTTTADWFTCLNTTQSYVFDHCNLDNQNDTTICIYTPNQNNQLTMCGRIL